MSKSTKWYVENRGKSCRPITSKKIAVAWSNSSTVLKILPYNTTWSALQCTLVNPMLHKPPLKDAGFVLVRIFNVLHIIIPIELISTYDQMWDRFALSESMEFLVVNCRHPSHLHHSGWDQRRTAVFAGCDALDHNKTCLLQTKRQFSQLKLRTENCVYTVTILCFMCGWKLASLINIASLPPAP